MEKVLNNFLIFKVILDKNMIFVISASSSIEIDIRERNSRQKVFSNSWGDPRHKKSKSKILKFQPYRKTQKGSLINIKATVTVNFREMKNAKTANPPFPHLSTVRISLQTAHI